MARGMTKAKQQANVLSLEMVTPREQRKKFGIATRERGRYREMGPWGLRGRSQ